MSATEIQIGVLPAYSPDTDPEVLERFGRILAGDVAPVLEEATGVRWVFSSEPSTRLPDDDPHRAADFMDEASLRMVEGPYDGIVVLTDVGVVSRKHRVVPGLASTLGRMVVLSTGRLQVSPRGRPLYALDSDAVRWNAATLLLHLLGHVLGLEHSGAGAGSVMAPFVFDESRRSAAPFSERSRSRLRTRASAFPERIAADEGTFSELRFHLSSALRHPRQTLLPMVRSRAPLLPLYLPRLATAAVAPALILVFTAEIWDAGFHMTHPAVWSYAAVSVLGAAAYLTMGQNLFLPHKEKRYQTEHLAVVNVGIFFTILASIVGLFTMLGLLMLGIQVFIFPPDLVREWPSLQLESATITFLDQVRIAALISTIGVLTGALGGGLESREVIRHLALFRARP